MSRKRRRKMRRKRKRKWLRRKVRFWPELKRKRTLLRRYKTKVAKVQEEKWVLEERWALAGKWVLNLRINK